MNSIQKCCNCLKLTPNPKFCSRSCSAIYTNKAFPKRKLTKANCRKCRKQILRQNWKNQKKVCLDCRAKFGILNKTLGEVTRLAKYQLHAQIRQFARKVFRKSSLPKTCSVCGYKKHYEVCHKKAISSFNRDARILEINNINNLVALCPNCHWEFDHGLLLL